MLRVFPYTQTHFEIDYSVDARASGEGLLWDLYVPNETERLAFSIHRTGPPSASEYYNRFHKIMINSGYIDYTDGQDIPVEPGKEILLTIV